MVSIAVRRLRQTLQWHERVTHGRGVPPQGADFRAMRESNRRLVLNCVRERGPLARVAIAQETGLSRSTVGSIIDTLLGEAFVREGSALSAAPVGGRRAIEVHFNADVATALGIELGRTHLTLALTNLAGHILDAHITPIDTTAGPRSCLPRVITAVREFIGARGTRWDEIAGVGVAVPSPVEVPAQTFVEPGILPDWAGVDLRDEFLRAFGVPVRLDNDANMGALAESRHGAGRGVAYLAYIKLGTGIGCGLVVDGQVYRGSLGTAGELGHVTVVEGGPLCVCGNRGCLETLAGTAVIVADAREGRTLRECIRTRGDEAGERALERQILPALADASDVDFGMVMRAAQTGDAAAIAALERAGEYIGIAVAGLVNIFNPSLILIGSGVIPVDDLVLAPLRRVAASRSLPSVWARTQVAPGLLGGSAIALGAATAVIDAAFTAFTASANWPLHQQRLATREEEVSAPSAAGVSEML